MTDRPLPEPAVAREWLRTMLLIRRFEERAGEMYAKARIGGFLHVSTGEEAAIVGSARALRAQDYLVSTHPSPRHARGRGVSVHMFDADTRFMGGYGIVGGNMPIAAGLAMASDHLHRDETTLCQFGEGAANQGTFGETLNLAALWRLPIVFMATNNRFGTEAGDRRASLTELPQRSEGFGVQAMRCDGTDVVDTHAGAGEALRIAREERRPVLVEAFTYRFRGHSAADPEEHRGGEQLEEWRRRDPVLAFGDRLVLPGGAGAGGGGGGRG